jgi:hypothetical protein
MLYMESVNELLKPKIVDTKEQNHLLLVVLSIEIKSANYNRKL